jgi:hypothetical protein
MTAPRQDGQGPHLAMKHALRHASLKPSDVDYVNAHATSTPLGDAAENRAIKELLLGEDGKGKASDINVSSTKGAIGHLLGAAGSVEAIFTVLGMHHVSGVCKVGKASAYKSRTSFHQRLTLATQAVPLMTSTAIMSPMQLNNIKSTLRSRIVSALVAQTRRYVSVRYRNMFRIVCGRKIVFGSAMPVTWKFAIETCHQYIMTLITPPKVHDNSY